MYSNVVTAIDKILRSYYVSTGIVAQTRQKMRGKELSDIEQETDEDKARV